MYFSRSWFNGLLQRYNAQMNVFGSVTKKCRVYLAKNTRNVRIEDILVLFC